MRWDAVETLHRFESAQDLDRSMPVNLQRPLDLRRSG